MFNRIAWHGSAVRSFRHYKNRIEHSQIEVERILVCFATKTDSMRFKCGEWSACDWRNDANKLNWNNEI